MSSIGSDSNERSTSTENKSGRKSDRSTSTAIRNGKLKRSSTLTITIVRAENLIKTQYFGEQDPYCLVWLSSNNSEKKRTFTEYGGGQNVKWDHSLIFLVEDLDSECLNIEVMNENKYRADNLIGRVEVGCSVFDFTKADVGIYKLQDSKGKFAGDVIVSIKNTQTSRPPSLAGSRAGSNAGSRAGSNAGSRAGSNSGSRAGSNAGSRAGSNSGSRAGSNAGSRSISRTGSFNDLSSPTRPHSNRSVEALLGHDDEEMSPAALAALSDGFPRRITVSAADSNLDLDPSLVKSLNMDDEDEGGAGAGPLPSAPTPTPGECDLPPPPPSHTSTR